MNSPKQHHGQGKRRREDPAHAAARRTRHLSILVLATLIAFASILPAGFVWQDHLNLTDAGARLLDWHELDDAFTLSQQQFRESRLGFVPDQAAGAWRPLAILANTLDRWLLGDCASCLHLVNLLWHLVTVIGLYALGRRLLDRRPHGKTLAFWATLLFAVHPLATLPVDLLANRDLLMGVALAISSLVALSRLPATSGSRVGGRKRWLVAVPLLYLGALLSHEATLPVPVLAILFAWYEMRERGRQGYAAIATERRLALALLLLMLALYLLLRVNTVGLAFAAQVPGQTGAQTLATLLSLLWHDLAQLFWPGEPVVSDVWKLRLGLSPTAMAGLLGLMFGIGLTLFGLRYHHPAALGATWFLLWILPVSGLFPLQRLQDVSHLYPAAWGLLLASVVILYRLWRPLGRQLSRSAELLLFTPLVIVLAVLTALSNLRFWDDSTLFNGELAHDPYYLEGRVRMAEHELRHASPQYALNHARLAVEAQQKNKQHIAYWPEADAHLALGQARLALALNDDALASLVIARTAAPHRAASWYGIGQIKLSEGDIDAAITALEAARARLPDDVGIRLRLGEAWLKGGRHEEGMALLIPMVDAGQIDNAALLALTDAFSAQGRDRAAIAHLQLALHQYDEPMLRARLASLLWKTGQREAARREITAALERDNRNRLVKEVAKEIMFGFPALPGTL